MAELKSLTSTVSDHESFMRLALEEARTAGESGEVPVGAVVVLDGTVIGRGSNSPIRQTDPTAHAEIRAIRDAAQHVSNYRLTGATLYVTVEPCLMCVGACVHARVATIVFGAAEPRTGALVSTVRAAELPGHNHRCDVLGGVLAEDCRSLMQAFFRARRGKSVAAPVSELTSSADE
jgi:tRNA(adenine34) deaminase